MFEAGGDGDNGNFPVGHGGEQDEHEEYSGNTAKVEASTKVVEANQAFESFTAAGGRGGVFEQHAQAVSNGLEWPDDWVGATAASCSTPRSVTPSGATPLGASFVEPDNTAAVDNEYPESRSSCVRRGDSRLISEPSAERSCVLTPVLSEELGDPEGGVATSDWLDAIEAILR